jgi:hypothetical protein
MHQEFNLTVFPKNPFTEGTHNHALYELLRERREITTKDIHRMGCETSRIRSDIRPFLRKHGLDYVCSYLEEGNRLYQVVRE